MKKYLIDFSPALTCCSSIFLAVNADVMAGMTAEFRDENMEGKYSLLCLIMRHARHFIRTRRHGQPRPATSVGHSRATNVPRSATVGILLLFPAIIVFPHSELECSLVPRFPLLSVAHISQQGTYEGPRRTIAGIPLV